MSKFNSWKGDTLQGKINHATDTLRVMLTNTAPNAADNVVDTTTSTCTLKATSNAAEIAAGSGYAKKGPAIGSLSLSGSSGTWKLTAAAVTVTASGGTIGPFQYAVFYSDTGGTTSTRPVIGHIDLAAAVTLQDGDSITFGKDNTGAAWDSTTPLVTDS